MIMYAVYINDDCDGEFETYQEASEYIKNLIRGTAEHYGKSQKYIRQLFNPRIEEIEYD